MPNLKRNAEKIPNCQTIIFTGKHLQKMPNLKYLASEKPDGKLATLNHGVCIDSWTAMCFCTLALLVLAALLLSQLRFILIDWLFVRCCQASRWRFSLKVKMPLRTGLARTSLHRML